MIFNAKTESLFVNGGKKKDEGSEVKEQISHTVALNNTDVLLLSVRHSDNIWPSAALIKTMKQKRRFVINKLL